jgi:hypothetical protein
MVAGSRRRAPLSADDIDLPFKDIGSIETSSGKGDSLNVRIVAANSAPLEYVFLDTDADEGRTLTEQFRRLKSAGMR